MRNSLVAGNWKMNGSLEKNQKLLDAIVSGTAGIKEGSCAVCVPYPYLPSVQSVLQNTAISWGAQNLSQYNNGAYTGEISAPMLNDFDCAFVIVGHSERRTLFGEDNDVVALKYTVAQNAAITPILCVGETLQQRETDATEQIISAQLDAVIAHAGVESLRKAVIAYEPVWAIGTGKTATPQQAQDVHEFIRKRIAAHDNVIAAGITILYGGSVKANNAPELFAMPDIDGGLIGGASLIAEDFVAICRAVQN